MDDKLYLYGRFTFFERINLFKTSQFNDVIMHFFYLLLQAHRFLKEMYRRIIIQIVIYEFI